MSKPEDEEFYIEADPVPPNWDALSKLSPEEFDRLAAEGKLLDDSPKDER